MPSEWYYTVNGQQAPAPANAQQLKQLVANGQLQPTDLIWQEGMPNWAPASTIKGLFSSSRSAPEGGGSLEITASRSKSRSKRGKSRDVEPGEDDSPGGVLGLHPVLVMLLSVLTLGLFALLYAYLACSAYSEQASRRAADSSSKPLGQARHPLAVFILSYLTFGFYFYYWAYRVMVDTLAYTGRRDFDPRIEVSLMLLFPPYAVFVTVFRLPEMIARARLQAKLSEASSLTHSYVFLIPCLYPAMPILSMAMQDALNEVWLQAP